MTMFARENDFDDLVMTSAIQYGIATQVIKGVIAQESAFNPDAVRSEAGGNNSVGLMQVTLSTARGYGFLGTEDDLKDPETNIDLGAHLLADLYSKFSNWPRAISAYNGGDRPSLGFGTVATQALTVCLAKDVNGNCTQWHNVAAGEFGNQPYVDSTMGYVRYFQGIPGGGASASGGSSSGESSAPSAPAIGLALGVAVALYFMSRGRWT
jgi:hypothetical protein